MAEAVISAAVPMLLIERCRDPLMWYAGMVGQLVPNCGMYPEGDWKSREPDGFTNNGRRHDRRSMRRARTKVHRH